MARKKLPPGVRIQDIFKEVAAECKEKVRGLPRGEKGRAWRQCIGEGVKARLAQLEAKTPV